MKYSQARTGRVFVVRLYDGEVLHEQIETLARTEGIRAATCIVVGGVDAGSTLVVGPEEGCASPVKPMETVLRNVHEICGTGTIFPDEKGNPVLHMHIACGREDRTTTGCVRKGVKVWQVLEVVVQELLGSTAARRMDPATGFVLMEA